MLPRGRLLTALPLATSSSSSSSLQTTDTADPRAHPRHLLGYLTTDYGAERSTLSLRAVCVNAKRKIVLFVQRLIRAVCVVHGEWVNLAIFSAWLVSMNFLIVPTAIYCFSFF